MPHEFRDPVPAISEDEADPVGVMEIAARLGVKDRSVHMWKRRDRLPAPDYDAINGGIAWEWATILWWAGETGRLYNSSLVDAYRTLFGHAPPANWRAAAKAVATV